MSATTSSIAAVVAAVATKTVGVLSVNVKLLKDTDENFDTNQRYSAFVAKYQDQLAELSKAIAKAGNGSLKACIKLKCLDCTNWEKKEVALCQATECPLWNVRPYKRLTRAEETLEKRLSLTVLS